MTTTVTVAPAAKRNIKNARRGVSLVLATASLTGFTIACSFAVDAGRLQLARGELRRAADAAARAGAFGFEHSGYQAKLDAIAWSKKNAVDGRTLTDEGIEVTIGHWSTSTRSFSTKLTGTQTYNAVRVVLGRPQTGPQSVPLFWASLLGAKGVQIKAEAIAMYVPGENVVHRVEGTANPFLAGTPKGATASEINPHNSVDRAGDAASGDLNKRGQSPTIVPLSVTPGQWIEFDEAATGTVRHDPNLPFFDADGELADIGHNNLTTSDAGSKSTKMYSQNGIADTWAPINSLVGVFQGDADPRSTIAPESLDFRTAASRDFDTMSPKSKQIFFVGDGVNSGGTRQRFKVPAGATKLYLATWDFYEWNNNAGYRTVRISRPGSVVTVK